MTVYCSPGRQGVGKDDNPMKPRAPHGAVLSRGVEPLISHERRILNPMNMPILLRQHKVRVTGFEPVAS